MTPSEITNALGQRLLALPDCPPVVWPNKNPDPLPERPYLVVQVASRRHADPTLNGTSGSWTGTLTINVVWEKNDYSTQADDLAESIRQRFKKATNANGIRVRSSEALAGYTTVTDYRVPVTIDWTS